MKLKINGTPYEEACEPRTTLADFIRHGCGFTGTHLGCEHGVCGACTILFNGATARSCLMLAVQADGAEIQTVEGLAHDGQLHPLQAAFGAKHGLQCGFCTPGMLMIAYELLQENADPSEEEIRERISSNLCRCTGYHFIVDSIRAAAEMMRSGT
ncbi:MAG: (2Fe-2S)-binding protein [Dehalococcoidia bacterium]